MSKTRNECNAWNLTSAIAVGVPSDRVRAINTHAEALDPGGVGTSAANDLHHGGDLDGAEHGGSQECTCKTSRQQSRCQVSEMAAALMNSGKAGGSTHAPT